ncbi:MAG: tetratricopeptide repeat protein [Candidatus Cloacimonetes bacterium]|nr:tetratricopeptide repeat protein [Candidatus Cloacimonadota bacterium]
MKNIIVILLISLAVNLVAEFQFAKELFEDGLYEEAINEFERIVISSPTSKEAEHAIFFIGESYRLLKMPAQAEKQFQRLWDGYPHYSARDKVLFSLAQAQLEQSKSELAIRNFTKLLTEFPATEYANKALEPMIKSIYDLQQYNQVIIEGRKFLQNYPSNDQLPYVMLFMAKAYFKNNIPDQGRKILSEINQNYPEHEARWSALQLEIDLLQRERGDSAAAELLSERLQQKLPRKFEEPLKFQLCNLYLSLQDYDKALMEITSLADKFTSSSSLDQYLTIQAYCRLKLGQYEKIIETSTSTGKIFRESTMKGEYGLYTAQAQYYLGEYSAATENLTLLLEETLLDSIYYQIQLLQGDILNASGKYRQAIDRYRNIMKSEFADHQLLLSKIGDIYLEKFQNYSKAASYYRQITLTDINPDDYALATYKLSVCLEGERKYRDAYWELQNLELSGITSSELSQKIASRKNYLQKFAIKDNDNAWKNMFNSLYHYLADDDKQSFKFELIDILSNDLKEFEQALQLLETENDTGALYQKALLNLQLAGKMNAAGKIDSASRHINNTMVLLEELKQRQPEYLAEDIRIRLDLFHQISLSTAQIASLQNFLDQYPDLPSSNEFRMMLINHYLEISDFTEAQYLIEDLQPGIKINREEFFRAKAALAEYHYHRDEDDEALYNFTQIASDIDLNRPELFFHYAVILNQTGNQPEALGKLEFLVNNAERFTGINNAISYYARILRELEDYDKAVSVQLLIPESDRDDNFYRSLAADLLKLDKKETAKVTLMHMVDKDRETLELLASLQYETDDLAMAEYTYENLLDKYPDELKYREMIGKIAFVKTDYSAASSNFKTVIDKLGDNFTGYPGIELLATELIISLYRLENRPQAESYFKKFKDILSESSRQEITLNEGIYYSKMDPKKAEKIFSGLLKSELNETLKYEIYYWRGLANLEQQKAEEALSDFSISVQSTDPEMQNMSHLKLGTLNFSMENYQKALDHYFQVIKQDQSGSLALDAAQNFAVVCKTQEEWQKAIAAYEIILERWGDENLKGETIFDIAFCHFRDKKYDNAVNMFQKAIPLLADTEQKAEAQYWIGESYYGQDDYSKSVTEFLKVGYNYPEFIQWAASGELRAGEAYKTLGDREKAVRIYERIIEKYGEYSQWGNEAAVRLTELQ